MKIRIEIADTDETEVVIRCRHLDDSVRTIENTLSAVAQQDGDLSLNENGKICYVPKQDILFFETDERHVNVHTADRIYTSGMHLFELEKLLPITFARASKSCIINLARISSVDRNLTGASEVTFRGSAKRAYISRSYYKVFMEQSDALHHTNV